MPTAKASRGVTVKHIGKCACAHVRARVSCGTAAKLSCDATAKEEKVRVRCACAPKLSVLLTRGATVRFNS